MSFTKSPGESNPQYRNQSQCLDRLTGYALQNNQLTGADFLHHPRIAREAQGELISRGGGSTFSVRRDNCSQGGSIEMALLRGTEIDAAPVAHRHVRSW